MYPADWPKCPGCGEPALDGKATCGNVGCKDRARAATLPTPIENLLPLALRRAFMQDAIVNAAFHLAAQRNATREQALIDTVLLLAADRERLMAELVRVVSEQPPAIIIRDNPRSITIDGDTFVPEDAGTRGPEDARPCDDESRCRICGHTRPCPDEVKHAERDWFFTFGSGHTYHGESLARAFVRFHGTALEARRKMYEAFGTAWSHQYATEEEAGVARFGLIELKLPDVVHILHLGGALCGKVGTPAQWESGHKWVALLNDDHGPRTAATCEGCLRSARVRDPITGAMTAEAGIEFLARQLAERPLTAEEERAAALRAAGERRVAAAIDADFPNNPLDEVFREHGEALLRALFAWRGQGSITRWKTRPSRTLAHLADRIGREYLGATGELQKAGVADAVADVLSAAARRRTPKGFAAELARLRDELGSLGELVDELADYAHEVAEDEPPARTVEAEDRES